jgi:pyrrolysyl-tRNA synthetase-like protein
MNLNWTKTQHDRLVELGAMPCDLELTFPEKAACDACFQELSSRLARGQKEILESLRQVSRRPALRSMEGRMVEALTGAGFVEVSTPLIMSRGLLGKMGVTQDSPLGKQVYWLDEKRCLRPMLAPHLYYVMKDLLRLWPRPVRIFEVGPCFRKESEGMKHSTEFTMLNLCEFGLPENDRSSRLDELATLVMDAVSMKNYRLESCDSKVYGVTLDVVDAGTGIELASGAMGPHVLDKAWGITEPWVGIGFGLERLLMARTGGRNIARFARSISYMDGARLNL